MPLLNIFRKRKEKRIFGEKPKEKIEVKKNDRVPGVAEKNEKTPKEKGGLSSKSVIKPHVTEKSSLFNKKGVYVFKVKLSFNKIMVKEAIKNSYGVNPLKIRIINMPSKSIFLKRRRVAKPGFKKAVVYLKKGEKINI